MLAESEKQNPELEHIEGDMRTLRLGRTFDGVLIHDAIMYMVSEEDLRAALLTAHEHCKPGGVAVFVPDWVAETFLPGTTHEGVDRGDRGVRYLEWTWDADPNDTKVNYEFILALKEGDELRTVVDRQVVGVFPRATWLRLARRRRVRAGSRRRPVDRRRARRGLRGPQTFTACRVEHLCSFLAQASSSIATRSVSPVRRDSRYPPRRPSSILPTEVQG